MLLYKNGSKYGALQTCPEGRVFPTVFLWTAALQYTTARQRPYTHVPCEHVPVRQGRYPLLLPQRAPPAPTTPVFVAAPAHCFTDSQQNGRPPKEDTHNDFADRLSWKENITCVCFVTAPFRHSYTAADRFCHHSVAQSRMAKWPSSVLPMRSPPGSSVSCILTVVGCCHSQPAHYKTCAAGFTTKWTPQSMRLQTTTEICQ